MNHRSADRLHRSVGDEVRDIPLLEGRGRVVSACFHVLGILIALALWWIGCLFLPADFKGFGPGPTFHALCNIIPSSHFKLSAIESLRRLGGGLGVAAVIGVPVGVAVGYFRRANEVTYVLFQFLRMVSPLSWMPIAIIIFGVGAGPVYFLIAIAAVWPIIISTAHGVTKVDQAWVKVARNFGAGHWQIIRRVVIPAVLPDILTGLRVALGVAWIVIVPAEMLGVASGLGYLILDYRDVVDYASIMAVILVIGFLGYTSDQLLRLLLRKLSWTG